MQPGQIPVAMAIYGYEPTIHLLSRLTFLTFSAGRAALQLFEITSKLTFTPSVL